MSSYDVSGLIEQATCISAPAPERALSHGALCDLAEESGLPLARLLSRGRKNRKPRPYVRPMAEEIERAN